MTYILFVIGFALLIKGADFLIDGASSIAKKLKISPLVIGLTIIAIGTSAPELIINIMSALQGQTDLALGNILGSNSVNILLILGLMAIIYPIAVRSGTVYKEIPFGVLAILVLAIVSNDVLIDGNVQNVISRSEGFIFFAFFAIYLAYTFSVAKSDRAEIKDAKEVTSEIEIMPYWKSSLFITLGIIALGIGSDLVVEQASKIAKSFGISETIIGLTIIAAGTSLPEFVTGIVSAIKKEIDIAVGNIIGSTICNTMGILGVTAIIKPIEVPKGTHIDIIINLIATILLFVTMFTGKRHILERWEGMFMVGIYIAYMGYIISISI